MTEVREQAAASAKAIMAAVTPLLVAFIVEVSAELNTLITGAIAAAATSLVVWLTPNGEQ